MQLLRNNRDLFKWVKYLPIISIIQLLSYNLNAQSKHQLPSGIRIVNLPDSFFAYKNLPSSLVIKNWFNWPEIKVKYYDKNDTSKLFQLYTLNYQQKINVYGQKFVGNDSNFLWVRSYLVAKQNKIGSLTPIIMYAFADDYDELLDSS